MEHAARRRLRARDLSDPTSAAGRRVRDNVGDFAERVIVICGDRLADTAACESAVPLIAFTRMTPTRPRPYAKSRILKFAANSPGIGGVRGGRFMFR
jgi:hypothetical protein